MIPSLTRSRGKAGDRDATPEQHSNGRTAAVLTARRETHVNVHHGHNERTCQSSSERSVMRLGAGSRNT